VMRMLYLFTWSIVPTVPASFLTFGSDPLYKFYEGLPHLFGLTTLADQQLAGLIMKIAAGLLLWLIIAVLFFRWAAEEDRANTPRHGLDELDRELAEMGLRR
jgi:putative membrane protein